MVISPIRQLVLQERGWGQVDETVGGMGEAAQPTNAIAMDGEGRFCKRSGIA
jgi:hypothetical protein